MNITVAIPSIPPRGAMLSRAVNSVLLQTWPADALSIAIDVERRGAAFTRTRAVAAVQTEWVALLDDDDQFGPSHLQVLVEAVEADPSADYLFPWFDVVGGRDPFPQHFGKVWDPKEPTQTTTTILVRTELAKQVGWLGGHEGMIGDQVAGEDFRFTLGCRDAGAKIVHVPVRTWLWHHHGANTSGRPIW